MRPGWLAVAGLVFFGLVIAPAARPPAPNLFDELEQIVGNAGEEEAGDGVLILTGVVSEHFAGHKSFDYFRQTLDSAGFKVSIIKPRNPEHNEAARYIATKISCHAFRFLAYWEYKILLKIDEDGTVYDIFAVAHYESL